MCAFTQETLPASQWFRHSSVYRARARVRSPRIWFYNTAAASGRRVLWHCDVEPERLGVGSSRPPGQRDTFLERDLRLGTRLAADLTKLIQQSWRRRSERYEEARRPQHPARNQCRALRDM
jgi:hypothetical protein